MKFKRYLVFVVVPLLFGATFSLQLRLDGIKKDKGDFESLLYLPSGRFLKPAALGFDELLADFLWVKAVTYFGGHYLTDKRYEWLYHILDVTTTLDPRFEYVYEFGGIILSIEGNQIKESIALLKKGIENHPKAWRLPFLLGFIHFYYLNDFETAAHYISKASLLPGRPDFLPSLTARLHTKAGSFQVGMEILARVYDSTDDERVRRDIEKKMKEMIIERDILLLEGAIKEYRERYGAFPKGLNELVMKGVLKSLPRDPFGGYYFMDPETTEVQSSTTKRRKIKSGKQGEYN